MNRADAKLNSDCEVVQENLMAYVDGQFDEFQDIDFKEHLEDCDVCSFIFNQVKQPVNLEESEIEKISVPDDLLPKIKSVWG